MDNVVVKVSGLSKKYAIGKQKDGSLRGTLGSIFSKGKSSVDEFWALKDVSFEIGQGDVVGIIGKNGAGKSTLLKILSQITSPTEGMVELNGRIASLLEVGTGFHPELTGRENVYLNGTILGMTRKEVKAKFDEIVEFSGIEKFIDTPVKHYSSGMYVRLAFAVAAHLEPEILIIDEVLAVGDAEFQKKCLGKMKDVAGQGRTVLFVSHHLGSVKTLCNKGILLEKGQIKATGDIESIVSLYQKSGSEAASYECAESKKDIYLASASIKADSNEFYNAEEIRFQFDLTQKIAVDGNQFMLVRIVDELENVLTCAEVQLDNAKKSHFLSIPANTLKKGIYYLNIIVYHPAVQQFDIVNCCNFEVLDNNAQYAHLETFDTGKLYLKENWS